MPSLDRELSALAGLDLPAQPGPAEPTTARSVRDGAGAALDETDAGFARRLLRVAELVTFGALVLLVASALLAAHYGEGSLRLHELPFAAWGLGAAICSLTSAHLAGGGASTLDAGRRRAFAAAMLAGLVVCVTGVVANADGVAGPAWVLFIPVVLVAGAVAGPALGLTVGASAAAGVYAAAGFSHTLTTAGLGRLLVLLPMFPAVGWSAGALAGLARAAAREAQARRVALESDVRTLTEVLDRVAGGDLTVVPAMSSDADPVTTGVAVAFADTLLALRRLVRQMDAVAGQLTASSVELAGAAEQEATAIGAQVAAVAETTTTIEELAATAAVIADTAVRVSQFAGSTRRDVEAGAAAVEESTAAFERIAARVTDLDARTEVLRERIGRISLTTHVIDEIARRTSILAVNASIEAARAGEHGHGFANVANEVGTLATRAREATARIDAVVADLEAEAAATAAAGHEGYDAVEAGAARQSEVVSALSRIAMMVDRTTHASREITEATRQQRGASDAVVSAMTTVTGASDRYRDGSRRHADAAGRLRDLAAGLAASLDGFTVA